MQSQSFNTKTAQSIPSNFDFSERQSCELPWVNFNAADDAREKAIAECRALSLEDRMPSFACSKGSPMSVGKPSGRDDLTHIFHFNKTDCMIHRKTASRVAAPRSMGHALIKLLQARCRIRVLRADALPQTKPVCALRSQQLTACPQLVCEIDELAAALNTGTPWGPILTGVRHIKECSARCLQTRVGDSP